MSSAITTICKTHIGLARLYLDLGCLRLASEQLALAEPLMTCIETPMAFLSCSFHVEALKRSVLWLPDWDKGIDDVAA